jgi:hypothetical protein
VPHLSLLTKALNSFESSCKNFNKNNYENPDFERIKKMIFIQDFYAIKSKKYFYFIIFRREQCN